MDEIITIEHSGAATIVNLLCAELSFEQAEELKKKLYACVSDTSNKFIVDLHQCGFMSSVALGVLVCFTAKVHSFDGRIVLCHPSKETSTVLAITKLDKIYDIYPTRVEALASFL